MQLADGPPLMLEVFKRMARNNGFNGSPFFELVQNEFERHYTNGSSSQRKKALFGGGRWKAVCVRTLSLSSDPQLLSRPFPPSPAVSVSLPAISIPLSGHLRLPLLPFRPFSSLALSSFSGCPSGSRCGFVYTVVHRDRVVYPRNLDHDNAPSAAFTTSNGEALRLSLLPLPTTSPPSPTSLPSQGLYLQFFTLFSSIDF
ncbi:hypothetical protein TIFTF001_033334 [Ficus carica]|uniref:Uncharacterized protein n=1 Tax=Ficus carica TaxID=3494 RepID=A0AA88DYC0_FICCA|nr:hypothetical protein TIFTF001_033334 [Ficus carica]